MTQITIEADNRTIEEWEEVLTEHDYNILVECAEDDYGANYMLCHFSGYEVFDYLIQYEGGAYSHRILYLLEEIFGIKIQ